jgi:hypothetical protein
MIPQAKINSKASKASRFSKLSRGGIGSAESYTYNSEDDEITSKVSKKKE